MTPEDMMHMTPEERSRMTPEDITALCREICARVKKSEGESLTMDELREACKIASKLPKILVNMSPAEKFEMELEIAKRMEQKLAMRLAHMDKRKESRQSSSGLN